MTIEMCIECDNPTGKAGACEDSLYVGDDGPFCETCFEWKGMVAEHKAVVEKLEAEVERLKAHTWEQERAAVVAWLRLEPSYQNRPWAVITADIERGEHWHG
jgi:hypothetical protein